VTNSDALERLAARLLKTGKTRALPTPGTRMKLLDAAIANAFRAKVALAASRRRCETGFPRWQDWIAVVGPDADALLVRAAGSLLVRAARRDGFIRGAAPADRRLDVMLEILSYAPGAEPPPVLLRQVEAMRNEPFDPTARVEHRFSAATAVLALGPEDGRVRRDELWGSGLVKQRGADPCDPQAWFVQSIIDWTQFYGRFSDLVARQGGTPLSAGEHYAFTFEEVAVLMRTSAGDPATRPSAANRGHTDVKRS